MLPTHCSTSEEKLRHIILRFPAQHPFLQDDITHRLHDYDYDWSAASQPALRAHISWRNPFPARGTFYNTRRTHLNLQLTDPVSYLRASLHLLYNLQYRSFLILSETDTAHWAFAFLRLLHPSAHQRIQPFLSYKLSNIPIFCPHVPSFAIGTRSNLTGQAFLHASSTAMYLPAQVMSKLICDT